MASSKIKRIGAAGLALGGAAAGAYLLDPDNGKRRRAIARDRVAAFFRRGYRGAVQEAQTTSTRVRDTAAGAVHEAGKVTQPDSPAPNDQTLADRVESEIFRPPDVPKGSVNVNAEAGIVYLRGEAGSAEQIEFLVKAAKAVDGVRAVENLLHLPGEPAKAKRETEAETRHRVESG